jgi:hypothetical protein
LLFAVIADLQKVGVIDVNNETPRVEMHKTNNVCRRQPTSLLINLMLD